MDPKELLAFCLEKGLLIDKEVLNLFSGTTDSESAKLIINSIRTRTGKRIITKSVFEDRENAEKFLSDIPDEKLKKLKIKLGLSIEISKEIKKPDIQVYDISPETKETNIRSKPLESNGSVKLISSIPTIGKKLEVGDFVNYFRNRFSEMRNILQERPELENLLSINKISGNRQGISIVGIVSDKKVTKNQNILLDVEDLTGKIKAKLHRQI